MGGELNHTNSILFLCGVEVKSLEVILGVIRIRLSVIIRFRAMHRVSLRVRLSKVKREGLELRMRIMG